MVFKALGWFAVKPAFALAHLVPIRAARIAHTYPEVGIWGSIRFRRNVTLGIGLVSAGRLGTIFPPGWNAATAWATNRHHAKHGIQVREKVGIEKIPHLHSP